MKKLAILGRGTAGAFSLTHYLKYTDWQIDWYFDDNINRQAVGEGSSLVFPAALYQNIEFEHYNLKDLDGHYKNGIYKKGWSDGREFIHPFPPPAVGYHFNATKFQDFVFSRVKDKPRISFIQQNVSNYNDIDSDYILDCRGKPSESENNKLIISQYIPVNSVYVTQCYWDYAMFDYTLTIARPYGWVFGIPLHNRCSIGYLYNNNITSIEKIKEDVKNIFEEYCLTPREDTNSFSFKNYYRINNFEGRVAYNGNASFFLEPLEATSITMMNYINNHAIEAWKTNNFKQNNDIYRYLISSIQNVIMLHYMSGSIYDNKFWNFAKDRGLRCIRDAINNDKRFFTMIELSNKMDSLKKVPSIEYGTWSIKSFKDNLTNLGLYGILRELKNT